MRLISLLLLLFTINTINGQRIYFDSISKVSVKSYTYKKYEKQKLKLDFYRPKKIRKNYPLIVFVHGGGFSGGKRNDNNIVSFANFLTERGYAVASVSYRLTMKGIGFGCNVNATRKINAFNNASEDISLALKYILKKRKFKINSKKIILMGSSAGAEAILNLAFVYENKILPKDFHFAGVISMAGALRTIDKLTLKTAVPTQLFHGIEDKLVPYNIAPHHYCDKKDKGYLTLYGSKAIADHLKSIDGHYYLYSVKNGDHSWNGRPLNECKEEILEFLYYDILKNMKRQIERIK